MAKLFLGTKEVSAGQTTKIIETLNIVPLATNQTFTASIGGYSPINVSAVTSAIDSNIQAGNIKKGVTILGVTGNVERIEGVQREVSDQDGALQIPTNTFIFFLPNNAINMGQYALYYAFQNCTGLTSVDLSSLTTVGGGSAMYYAFQNCTSLTSVDLSSLTTISGYDAMYYAFQNCTSLTSVDLSSLTTISGQYAMSGAFQGCTGLASVDLRGLATISGQYAMRYAFQNCSNLVSVDLSNLTTLSGQGAIHQAFYNCKKLTSVDLSNLTTIRGRTAMNYTFQGCTSLTSLSFPALTSTSFGSYTNQFSNMLSGVTGCTVHFPSNLQSVIGSWSDVTAGFGGTNTTVSFDLPAT